MVKSLRMRDLTGTSALVFKVSGHDGLTMMVPPPSPQSGSSLLSISNVAYPASEFLFTTHTGSASASASSTTKFSTLREPSSFTTSLYPIFLSDPSSGSYVIIGIPSPSQLSEKGQYICMSEDISSSRNLSGSTPSSADLVAAMP